MKDIFKYGIGFVAGAAAIFGIATIAYLVSEDPYDECAHCCCCCEDASDEENYDFPESNDEEPEDDEFVEE